MYKSTLLATMIPRLLNFVTVSLAFLGAASAAVVPLEGEDGIYVVHTDDAGTEVHTKIADLDPALLNGTTPNTASLNKRAVAWPGGTYPVCVSLQWIGHYDFYDGGAWQYFYSACEEYSGHRFYNGDSLYSRYGTAVAYMCSYSNDGNPCSVGEWVDAVNWIAGTCSQRNNGYMESAYLTIPSWKKAYGYTTAGSGFCH
ncbi:hypothetical protein Cob_v008026 [Colletotrichum orbiculare MAFF 240422]|uniref:Uncharacterized protein n=1 Tax=Colletotrichum orbiculare (strain 104-T / ATCC 96160 / CBS 514.97 / LARS 414 / MAFF 240422) TaxID=1213857 RepID=N4VG72_COLOR|nr:hypothetical protein Cob_v008026 [Colletotrichum orbiculare MAFF 240422]